MKYLIMFLMMLFLSGCVGPCQVWVQEYRGKAMLAQAKNEKMVQIEDAKGKLESSKLLMEAEIQRAKGVAEANKIIGDSLKGNEAYLRYLWVQGLHDGNGEVIYIPTEAGMPILEAQRLSIEE